MIKSSVVTAIHNWQQTAGQAIDSVLSQTYPAVESIVIDGASTDGTLAALAPYNPRLGVFIGERDQGIYDALDEGSSMPPLMWREILPTPPRLNDCLVRKRAWVWMRCAGMHCVGSQ